VLCRASTALRKTPHLEAGPCRRDIWWYGVAASRLSAWGWVYNADSVKGFYSSRM